MTVLQNVLGWLCGDSDADEFRVLSCDLNDTWGVVRDLANSEILAPHFRDRLILLLAHLGDVCLERLAKSV